MSEDKPPLGLMPEQVFEEDRQYERLTQISDAICRYALHGKPVPVAWTNELKKRIDAYRHLMTHNTAKIIEGR